MDNRLAVELVEDLAGGLGVRVVERPLAGGLGLGAPARGALRVVVGLLGGVRAD